MPDRWWFNNSSALAFMLPRSCRQMRCQHRSRQPECKFDPDGSPPWAASSPRRSTVRSPEVDEMGRGPRARGTTGGTGGRVAGEGGLQVQPLRWTCSGRRWPAAHPSQAVCCPRRWSLCSARRSCDGTWQRQQSRRALRRSRVWVADAINAGTDIGCKWRTPSAHASWRQTMRGHILPAPFAVPQSYSCPFEVSCASERSER